MSFTSVYGVSRYVAHGPVVPFSLCSSVTHRSFAGSYSSVAFSRTVAVWSLYTEGELTVRPSTCGGCFTRGVQLSHRSSRLNSPSLSSPDTVTRTRTDWCSLNLNASFTSHSFVPDWRGVSASTSHVA